MLFSSMLSTAELYLSENKLSKAKNSSKKPRNRTVKLKRAKDIGKLLTKKEKHVDGIEKLLNSNTLKKNKDVNVAESLKSYATKIFKYSPEKKKFSVKKAIKNLYANFKNYGSKGYGASKNSYETDETNTKKVVGFVKYSMEKYMKVFEFILTMAQPQWNKVPGSPEDKDTNAHIVTQNSSVGDDNLKYNLGYSSIRFRY